MNEFSSVSVPAFDASSLTTALNERSAEGWTVVAIVPADGSVIAYLSRPTGSAGAASAPAASNATLSPEPASASPSRHAGGSVRLVRRPLGPVRVALLGR